MKFLALNFIFLSLSTQTIFAEERSEGFFAELATEFPHLEAAANSVAKLYIYNSEKSKKEFMFNVLFFCTTFTVILF